MKSEEPKAVLLRKEQEPGVLHHPPPYTKPRIKPKSTEKTSPLRSKKACIWTSMWRSQLREPVPNPFCKWYPGTLPSKQTAMEQSTESIIALGIRRRLWWWGVDPVRARPSLVSRNKVKSTKSAAEVDSWMLGARVKKPKTSAIAEMDITNVQSLVDNLLKIRSTFRTRTLVAMDVPLEFPLVSLHLEV